MKFPPGDKVEPITKIAESLGLDPDHLIPYGRYKAKISLDALKDPADYRGKLVVVTGITPTPAGEGKTTTAIGLTQGMGRLGHKVEIYWPIPSPSPGQTWNPSAQHPRRRKPNFLPIQQRLASPDR